MKAKSDVISLDQLFEITRGIEVALENKCYQATIVLLYSGIDFMASLNLPENQENVSRKDFKSWFDQYIQIDSQEKISSEEAYSARCGVLHSMSPESNLTKNKNVRLIGYADGLNPPIKYNQKVDKDLVIVDITTFVKAFRNGVEKFIINVYKNPTKASLVESRLRMVFRTTSLSQGNESNIE